MGDIWRVSERGEKKRVREGTEGKKEKVCKKD